MPTQIYSIDGPWPGSLAISARPRGGDWLRDEVQGWRDAGLDVVVSLLTSEEVQEMDLAQEAEYCRENHMEFMSFPIVDQSVPESRAASLQLIERLESDLAQGKTINVHCRQGIGRSSLIAAGVLIAKGVPGLEALERISKARHSPVPETSEQRKWIDLIASSLALLPQSKIR
jgi:protein-tyrosine phosphatase